LKLHGRSVIVNDGNFDKALRKFKKKIAESGVLQDLRDKEFYAKPTTVRKTKKAQAKRRWTKYQQSQELPKKLY